VAKNLIVGASPVYDAVFAPGMILFLTSLVKDYLISKRPGPNVKRNTGAPS
jgi:hypothetical protein